MAEVRASASRPLAVSHEQVFALISDLSRRKELLPGAYANVTVSDSEPAVVSYRLHAGGRERDYAMRQLPGADSRSWREEDEGSTLVTVWTLTPHTPAATTVEITTRWQGAGGIGGFFEKTFAPKGVGKLHKQTLDNVAAALGC